MKKLLTRITLVGTIILLAGSIVFSTPQKTEAGWQKWVGKGVFYVLNAIVEKYYNIPAKNSTGHYGSTITPGTLKFNQGKVGTSVKFPIYAQKKGHSVALYIEASPGNWFKHVALILTNSKGKDVINKSVNPSQIKGYKFPKKERYVARFVVTNKMKGAPYIAYRYDGANGIFKSVKTIEDDGIQNLGSYGDVLKADFKETTKIKKTMNIYELTNEMKDDSENYVYSMRNFKAGDTINFKDIIHSVEYDSDEAMTTFTFESNYGDDYFLTFANDLTSKYKKGQTLNLKFKVESLNNSEEYSVPNYYKALLDGEGKVPSIDKYLMK